MSLLKLPNELLLEIGENLNSTCSSLGALIQTSRHFATLLTPVLHTLALQDVGDVSALQWAIVPTYIYLAVPSRYTVFRSYEPLVRLLLSKGIDVNYTSNNWPSETQYYAPTGARPTDVVFPCHPALHRALFSRQLPMVRLLLEHGADVNAGDASTGEVPLGVAIREVPEAIEILLEAGADVRAAIGSPPFFSTDTMLHLAVDWCRGGAVLEALLERGAEIDAKGFNGNTALHTAVNTAKVEVVRLLLEKGADVAAKGYKDQTPLHLAAKKGGGETVRLLLEKGAEVDPVDSEGRTPIHRAVAAVLGKRGGADAVVALLEAGADITLFLDANAEGAHVFTEYTRLFLEEPGILEQCVACRPDVGPLVMRWAFGTGSLDVANKLLGLGFDVPPAEPRAAESVAEEGPKENGES